MHEAHDGDAAPRVHPLRDALDAEVVVVGSDLLQGAVGDSSAQLVAGVLTARGAKVRRMTFVPDDPGVVAKTIRACLERNPHLLITIGGLGPADDDRTLEAVADALKLPLKANPVATAWVDRAYARLHDERRAEHGGIDLVREKLTHLPVGCTPLPNEHGVAPGVLYRIAGGTTVICVPGTPREARTVCEQALPYLKDYPAGAIVARREIEAPVPDESAWVPLLRTLREEYPDARFTTRPVGSQKKGFRLLAIVETTGETEQEAESQAGRIVSRVLALAAGNK